MHRRRGLVSKGNEAASSTPSSPRRRAAGEDSVESSLSSSESSGFSSSLSESEDDEPREVGGEHADEEPGVRPEEKTSNQIDSGVTESKNLRGKKRRKREISEEDRWQKIKLKGSDKEILVDKTRIQKYVDFDSTGVASFQAEVKEIKGNFRQQTLADYSDL